MTTPNIRALPDLPAADESKRISRQFGTIGNLFEEFRGGDDAKIAAIKRHISRSLQANSRYFVYVRAEEAPDARRMEMPQSSHIDYLLHNPPGAFGDLPYATLSAIVRGDLRAAIENGYSSHPGEELLFTTDPGLHYLFPSQPDRPDQQLRHPVPENEFCRIRPQFAHLNFQTNGSRSPVKAWMFLRSLSGTMRTSAYPVGEIDEGGGALPQPEQAFLTPEQVADPTCYGMFQLGLPASIRHQRQRAGLTINQLAHLTAMNASYLGRLEKGQANIAIETLRNLANFLGIDLTEITEHLGIDPAVIGATTEPHWLHPYKHELPAGARLRVTPATDRLAGDTSSWVLVSGEAIFELNVPKVKTMKEIITADGVLHLKPLRETHDAAFTARQDCVFLEVRHSARCTCSQRLHQLC